MAKRQQQLTILLLLLLTASVWLAVAAPVEAVGVARRPAGIQTLYYGRGAFQRVFACHTTRGCGVGNYVPGMRLRRDADGFTAVNYNSRWMLAANVVIVADLWNSRQQRWVRCRLQVADYQMRRDSTGNRQRLEIDYATALRVGAVPGNTVARIIRIERGR